MSFRILMDREQQFHLVNKDVTDPDVFIVLVAKGTLYQVMCQDKVIGVQASTHLRATILTQALDQLAGSIPVRDWHRAKTLLYAAARQCMSD